MNFGSDFTAENGRIDTELKEKLKRDAPGILFELIRGAADYYREGLRIPKSMNDAKEKLFSSTDYAARFFAEQIAVTGLDIDFIGNDELRNRFQQFIEDSADSGTQVPYRDLVHILMGLKEVSRRQRGPRGYVQWGWTGATWK